MSRIVAAFIGLLLWVDSACLQAQGACPAAGGAPRTQACTDEPASLPAEGPDRAAGNPIDVITGNKYERVVDHSHPLDPAAGERSRRVEAAISVQGSPWWSTEVLGEILGDTLDLSMVRHYNSRNTYSLSLGPGWSHGYDTRLARLPRSTPRGRGTLPAAVLQVLQADGRRIRFLPLRRVDRHTVRYRAIDVGDGTIDEHDDPGASVSASAWTWRWPGGRELAFDPRGRLISIRSGNGDRLELRHDDGGRLAAVSDDRGRTLAFEYYPMSLPPAKDEPAGHAGRLAAVVLVSGRRIVYRYDRFGSLAEVIHPSGASTRYRYDSASSLGHLTGIESSDGRRARFAYDEQGRAILSQAAPHVEPIELVHHLPRDVKADGETLVTQGDRRSTYRWRLRADDGSPMLLAGQGTPCDGCPRTGVDYGFDNRQRLATVAGTDAARPGRLRVHRDPAGRVVGIDDTTTTRATMLRRYRYDGDETTRLRSLERPSVSPWHGNTVTIDRDATGRPVAVVEQGWLPMLPEDAARPMPVAAVPGERRPLERRVSFTYAAADSPDAGLLTSITDPLGNVHAFEHHRRRLSEVRYPIPDLRDRFEHDALGRIVRRTPIDGVIESYGYDDADRLVTIERAGRRWTVRHAPSGLIEAFEDNGGRRWRVEHDEHGRPRRLVDGGGASISIDRDDNERTVVTRWRDAIGELERQETTGFDDRGRISVARAGTASPTRTRHDRFDRIVERTDPVGIVSRWSFDPDTNEVVHRMAAGSPVEATLTRRSTVDGHRVVDPAGRTWRQWRDDFERIVLTDEPDIGLTMFRHDAAGRLVTRITREGGAVEYRHDPIGRLVAIAGRSAYRYEGTRLVERREHDQHESFRHDAAGRVIERTVVIDEHRWTETFGFDGVGRLVERRLADGNRLTYEHDPRTGQVSSITFNGHPLLSAIETDVSGVARRWLNGNGTRTSIATSAEGRISRVDHSGDRLRIEESVVRDDAGRIVAIERQGPSAMSSTRRMTYDPLGRLVAVAGPAGGVDRWRYDAAGERIGATPAGASPGPSYEFDADRRLVALRDAVGGQVIASYRYNTRGERIAKQGVGYYLYDNRRLAAETDASGVVTGQHVYLGDRAVAWLVTDPRCVQAREDDRRRLAGGGLAALRVRWQQLLRGESDVTGCTTVHAVHTDHLGTPIALSDRSGNLVWHAEHDPWGNVTGLSSSTAIPYNIRFPGQYFDAESGLHYNYHRYYDPRQGRYLTPDPIGLAGGLYNRAYADLDPVGRSDPLGLATFMCTQPLHGLGPLGPIVYAPDRNPFYHQFLAVIRRDGSVHTGGQDRAGGLWSAGTPSLGDAAIGSGSQCSQVEADNECLERCLMDAFVAPRPPYAIAFGGVAGGENCQQWANRTLADCRGACPRP